jgi:DNA polymerase-3 subunit epsilon
MIERLSLRVRIFLFFALIAAAVPILLGVGLWLAAQRLDGNPTPHLVLFGGAAGFALIGVVVWVWQLFDQNIARPIQAIVRDLQTVMHANPQYGIRPLSRAAGAGGARDRRRVSHRASRRRQGGSAGDAIS